MIPRATLRLQFHKDFTFADAERRVPYIASLGISHVYASPITKARAGSLHGYDVIDPTAVNPELGGEQALRSFVAALRDAGLGLIVDIVPNHMAADLANSWWVDVLRCGRAGPYAGFLASIGTAVAARSCCRCWANRCGKQSRLARSPSYRIPRAVKPCAISRSSSRSPSPWRGRGISPPSSSVSITAWHGGAWPATKSFDINELVSLRQEVNETFTATHALILRLYAQGLVDGVRVDHVDGLRDRGDYCRKLRAGLETARPGSRPYIVVEKILLRGEALLNSWETDGTTGYDFMDEVNLVQHDPRGEAALARVWAKASGRSATFAPEEELARREIVARSFSAQLDACVRACHPSLQDLLGGDLGRATLRRALVEAWRIFPSIGLTVAAML